MNSRTRVSLLVLAAALLSGCGAYRSTTAILQAQQRYESAKAAGAERKAPYEYTLGVEFLRKAREEAGYSDYMVSERLAQQAQALLAEAAKQASGAGSAGEGSEEQER